MTRNKRRDQQQKQRHNDPEYNPALGGDGVKLQQIHQFKGTTKGNRMSLVHNSQMCVILIKPGCSAVAVASYLSRLSCEYPRSSTVQAPWR